MSSQAAQFRHARPALLENGIEDEKASAGDHAATLGHKARSVDVTVHKKHKHLITDKVSQSVLVPVDRRASQPRSRLSDQRSAGHGVKPVGGQSTISTESLILAQDERWRRA